ncbi:MAG: FAD-dependent oxidoreductase [Alicyclobacillaceae bacterium]|nr:FAD-dependent oxidoreductase [Alicyclobacillaceae bacterium]
MSKERILQFDVVVVGGGSAGVAAAVGAASMGAKTLIIEQNAYFGGAATHSSVMTYCGFYAQKEPMEQVVGGVGDMVLRGLQDQGSFQGPIRNPASGNIIALIDAESTKYVLDQILVNAGVTPRLHCQVVGAVTKDGHLEAIECYHHGGRWMVEAAAFVDASGDADLTAAAGGQVRYGDGEGNVQAGTLVMRIGGVPREMVVRRDILTRVVRSAKEEGHLHLSKERGMTIRLPLSGDILALLVDEAVNGLDSASLTDAEMSARRQAWTYLELMKKYLPGFEDAYLVQTGPSIGIRETRHVLGEVVLNGEDVLFGVRRADAVARGGWPVEVQQPGERAVYSQIKDKSFYDIPLGALKVKEVHNLWCAGRILSCDATAFASARVMGTAFATGHAAGVAAAHHASFGSVSVASVQRELLRQGAIL